ncbi:hypothetical protein GCM10027039_08240 [Terrabacter koreensis]
MSSRLTRLIAWPLWSWRNVSVSVAALLIALAIVGRAVSFLDPRPVAAPVDATARTSPPPTEALPVETSKATPNPGRTPTATPSASTGSSRVGPSTDRTCQAAAASFMGGWVKTNLPQPKWLDGLRPYAVPELIDQLSHTDPSSVPASQVSPNPVQVLSGPGAGAYRFATDGGRVDVTTQRSGAACLVGGLEPANDVPGAPTPTLTAAQAGG